MFIQQENAMSKSETRRYLEKKLGTKEAKKSMKDLYNGKGLLLLCEKEHGTIIEKFDPFGMSYEKSQEIDRELAKFIGMFSNKNIMKGGQ